MVGYHTITTATTPKLIMFMNKPHDNGKIGEQDKKKPAHKPLDKSPLTKSPPIMK
jgi:hypothetical protein